MLYMPHQETEALAKAKSIIAAAGFHVSVRSWEDDRSAYACSVESGGPAVYGHATAEAMLDKPSGRWHFTGPCRTIGQRMTNYPAWTATRSNEDFDRAQQLANELTEADRQAGNPAPTHGYSLERFEQARQIVRNAQR